MKNFNNKDTEALDRMIAGRLQQDLPQARENEWFTRRVMNRLPEKRTHHMARLTQWLCYLSAVGALCGGGWLTARYILTNGFTETTFVLLALIPLIMVFIAGIFAAPALRKVIEGEQSILK